LQIYNLGNLVVNNYLIRINGKIILIDTGYPNSFNKFLKKLKKLNIELSKIDYVFLTHAHDDHAGFLNEIIYQTNAIIILDEIAKDRLLVGHNEWIGGCSGRIAKLFILLMGMLGKSKHEYPKVVLNDRYILFNGTNQPFEENAIQLHVIRLPGHTEDSIGIYNKDVLFCGDAAMNGFPSINNQIIWIENLEAYTETWEKMINLGVKEIYPSHGKKFNRLRLVKSRNKIDRIKILKIREPKYS